MLGRKKESGPEAAASGAVRSPSKRLGEILCEEGVITEGQLQDALKYKQEHTGVFIGQALVELGHLSQDVLISFLVKQCKIPHLSLLDYDINPELFEFLPRELCIKHSVLPIDKLGRILTVAMVDPFDVEALEEIRSASSQLRIKPILCHWQHFNQVVERLLGPGEKKSGSAGEVTAASFGLAELPPGTPSEPEPPATTDEIPAEALSAAVDGILEEVSTRPASAPPKDAPAPQPKASTPKTGQHEGVTADVLATVLRETMGDTLGVFAQQVREAMREAMGEALNTWTTNAHAHRTETAEVEEERRRDLENLPAPKPRRSHASVVPFGTTAEGALAALDQMNPDDRVLSGLDSAHPLAGYTFDNFYPGEPNAFTFKMARAVSDKPGDQYNPFFLQGPVGVGKTHLINAIGNHIAAATPDKRVGYVSASHFVRCMEEATTDKALDEFRANYCHWDVLILDDIQFLGGKIPAQEEFFHIFNVLIQENRQIIIAGDRPPEKLGLLEQRLVSRFAGGVVAELKAPDRRTLVQILEKEQERAGSHLGDDILMTIAMRVPNDVRRLRGAFRKVVAFAEMGDEDISSERAEQILGHLVPESAAG